MKKSKSIVYVNYCPYENSGHILDYLNENFNRVYLFSIAFHSLGNAAQNKVSYFDNGKLIKEEFMTYLKVPEDMEFLFIPIRSAINCLQIVLKIIKIRIESGPIDNYFTVNAFTATIGRFLKLFKIVDKTIFWVWDYYPISFPTLSGKIMRFIYWQFDKFATFSDKVFYLNMRMADVRKQKKVISKKTRCIVVPIGTSDSMPVKKKSFNHIKLGFIGVIKKSQGVEMLVNSAPALKKYFKKVSVELIGSGPDEIEFKKKSKNIKGIKYNFYGYVSEVQFKRILYGATIGVSPYMPEKGNVSKYTDPGKPKRYIEFNLPVITTDVIEFAKEIKTTKAGEIINYDDYEGFAKSIEKIIKSYDKYVKGAIKLNKKYYYRNIYPKMFV